MTKKYILRAVALVLVCVMLASLGGCSAARRVRAGSRAEKTVAVADEMEIPYENLYYIAMTRIAELERVYGKDVMKDPARQEELKQFVWENLLTRSDVLIEMAKEYDLFVDRGEIGDNVQTDMETILENDFGGDRGEYVDWLNEVFMTDHYLRTYLAVEEYLPEALVKAMLEAGDIDDSDERARDFLASDSFFRVRQVLIETRNYGSAEEALAKAEALRAKVASKTTDTERNSEMLKAMAFSTDLDTTGNGLYFAKGEMNAAYEQAVIDLPFCGVSEVMEVTGGYCFVMRLRKDEAYMQENFQTLKEKTYNYLIDLGVAESDLNNLIEIMTN